MSAVPGSAEPDRSADVIVVGAGPAGATAATYLARSGVDVLLLEKSTFPRDKVCGDGLTPRGVKQVLALGVDVSGDDWIRNKGLRVVGGGTTLELPWPTLADFPDFGLVRPRRDFDEMLATLAVKAGARMHQAVTVTAPEIDDRTGAVTGVTAKTADGPARFHAPLVLAADGVSARLAAGLGINKRDDRPIGVAVRRYYTSPPHPRRLPRIPPGAVGPERPGALQAAARLRLDLRPRRRHRERRPRHAELVQGVRQHRLPGAAADLAGRHPGGVGTARGERDRPDRRRRSADGLQPHSALRDGLLLVGDAGGAVNPFNGEGIAYAMESAALAAEVVLQALGRPDGAIPRGGAARLRHRHEAAHRGVLPARRHLLHADREACRHEDRDQAGPAPQAPDVPGAQDCWPACTTAGTATGPTTSCGR